MISREEAKEDFELQEISLGYVNSSFLDRIYDSIGTCGECDRWEQFIAIDFDESYFGNCYLINDQDNIWHKLDYCTKFEPRKDQ